MPARMVSAYEQDTIEHTKDFVSCIGGTFSDVQWNLEHGQACWDKHNSSCFSNPRCHDCVPIPAAAPYNVDCSWIKNRAEVAGGTGILDGVGASEEEQYLSAFYFSLVTVTTVGYVSQFALVTSLPPLLLSSSCVALLVAGRYPTRNTS